jgi:peptidoglycan/xylan/chitin deacetylase (PgdA/CDA1 family)
MYHSLDSTGSVVSVEPQIFEAQMAGLSELRYRVVSLKKAIAQRRQTGDWPDKTIVLTFDDGYENIYDKALPILQRYGFGATVFVVAGHVDATNSWEQQVDRHGRRTMLSWDQLKDLADHDVEIGAHTLSHPDLSTLELEAVENEIVGSAEEISSKLNEPVQTFAYPYGKISTETADVVERTFEAACTTVHRRACDEPLMLLPRIEMYYFRNQRDLQPLVSGQLDRAVAVRRLARGLRRCLNV